MKNKGMIELSNEERTKLKNVQLELLDAFSDFCKKNKLTFYLYGGTLLGAHRHKGFIPWDDDIDLCMPRDDYDKLLEIFDNSNGKYFLQNCFSDKKYFYHFSKFGKKNTLYNEYVTQNIECYKYIYVDVFPINNFPDRKMKKFLFELLLFLLNKRTYPRAFIHTKKLKRSFVYCFLSVLSFGLFWWMPYNFAAVLKEKLLRKQKKINTSLCLAGTNLKKVYKKEFFCGLKLVEFEGRKMPAPSNYELYLKAMYGDYMALPDVNDRIPHHYLVDIKF